LQARLKLLQADVERLLDATLIVDRDHLEVAVVEVQADHAAVRVDDTQLALVRGPPHLVVHLAVEQRIQIP